MTRTALKENTNIVAKEFFQVSLVTYLLLTLAETLKEGFVSNFFNMNYLLVLVLVTGVAMVLTEPEESPVRQAMEQTSRAVQQTGRAVAQTAANVVASPLQPRRWMSQNVIDLSGYKSPAQVKLEQRREAAKRQMQAQKNRRQLG